MGAARFRVEVTPHAIERYRLRIDRYATVDSARENLVDAFRFGRRVETQSKGRALYSVRIEGQEYRLAVRQVKDKAPAVLTVLFTDDPHENDDDIEYEPITESLVTPIPAPVVAASVIAPPVEQLPNRPHMDRIARITEAHARVVAEMKASHERKYAALQVYQQEENALKRSAWDLLLRIAQRTEDPFIVAEIAAEVPEGYRKKSEGSHG